MSKRTVLVIAHYFPPMGISGVMRTVRLVKYLALHNWNPIVLTTTPSHYYNEDEALVEECQSLNIEIIRTAPKKKRLSNKAKENPSKSLQLLRGDTHGLSALLHQPDIGIEWRKAALATAETIIREREVNVIMASAPPFSDLVIARDIAEQHSLPFVVDYRTMWLSNSTRSYPTPMHKNNERKQEEDILKRASHVVVNSRYAKEMLIKHYRFLRYDDIAIVPDSFDGEYFDDYYPHEGDHKLLLTHCGDIHNPSLTKSLLSGLERFLKKNPQYAPTIELRFVGWTAGIQQKKIEKMGLTQSVIQTGFVSYYDSIKQMLAADVLVLSSDTDYIPEKLYEYLGARKPIFACVHSPLAIKAAEETGAAIIAKATTSKDIEKKLEEIVGLWQKRCLPIPDEQTVQRYDVRNHIGELSRILAIAARF